ncbi:diguanylate cyclase domain-containing protein [Sulfuricurvum sp.]|uniref:diguanylate cyclase domain-containing protein n=1 Tax=Sulfuricurvum sp. TaxID=2025608 RepID=UPI002E373845|nr:diguanylate cyclase [Sulfuricurvum sp.]HEX5330039.1 diguanylate cyclase [Sulfuricurvum sp.]
MNQLQDETFISNEDDVCHKLFQSAIDTQKNLIVLLYQNRLVLFNKAFQEFTNMPTVKMFLREFGSLPNRFVPHEAYFHAGKASNPQEWTRAIMELSESDRIVSMINYRADPFAFSVTIEEPVEDYTIVSFCDISQDLIKRIMIENDVSIDKESGAFNKDYFVHTSKSFQNAAEFNEKAVGITMIELMSSDSEADKYLHDFTSSIKCNIRQSDMLVRWDKKTFLLAYLIDNADNAMKFSRKLLSVMREEPFENLKTIQMRLGTTIQLENELIPDIIERAQSALARSQASQTTLL